MKNRMLSLVSLLCVLGWTVAADEPDAKGGKPQPLKVLFIGNSFTGFNQMTKMVEWLSGAAQVDRPLKTQLVAPGGYLLEEHWNVPERMIKVNKGSKENGTLKTLQEGAWDIVFLQGYTDAIHDPVNFLKYGKLLAEEARKKNARVILYETWPPGKGGDYRSADELGKLNKAYFTLARETGATVSPAGIAFDMAIARKPGVGTTIHYGADGRDEHPSRVGSYLIACVHFAAIYNKSPVGLPGQLFDKQGSFLNLDPDMALFLQTVAWDSVQQAQKLMAAENSKAAVAAP